MYILLQAMGTGKYETVGLFIMDGNLNGSMRL
jgi:hypothetical protein